jgi:hypothetical protein
MLMVNLLDAPTDSLYRVQVDNAALSEFDYYDDGPAVIRAFNATSHLR